MWIRSPNVWHAIFFPNNFQLKCNNVIIVHRCEYLRCKKNFFFAQFFRLHEFTSIFFVFTLLFMAFIRKFKWIKIKWFKKFIIIHRNLLHIIQINAYLLSMHIELNGHFVLPNPRTVSKNSNGTKIEKKRFRTWFKTYQKLFEFTHL